MTVDLSAGIVRVLRQDGEAIGAGFVLTGDGLIVTCAHVVALALGIPAEERDMPTARVRVDLPLVLSDCALAARVIWWRPGRDVAGLDVVQDLPSGVRPLTLVTTDDLWNHGFRAFGFPAGYDDGVWASGRLLARQAAGWVQVEDTKVTGHRVQPGFSGTPIWDEQLNGVVGMAVAVDTDRATKAAFMIPARALIEAWPEAAAQSVKAGSRKHVQMQLARLKKARRQAGDPARFQLQIDTLEQRIAGWDCRVERQRDRITEGMDARRRQVAAEQERRGKHLRVVGQPPLDVADYFKDRERDLKRLSQLLAEPTTRLVSVIGRGGMGKTALACKVLQDLERHRWPHTDEEIPLHGIVYLSTRTDGVSLERLFLNCARLLGDRGQERLNAVWTNPQLETREKVTRLLEALSEGRYVILLDNLEELLDEEGEIEDDGLRLFFEEGVRASGGARMVVTSRVSLAFRREVMRFDRQVRLLEGLPLEDGVTLLQELDPNGDYGLRDAPEAQLGEAVRLTHGVPRALEVLAGILANDPFISLEEVLDTFYEQEDVVQSLIEENYQRLDMDARRVIEALAVFKKPVVPLAVDYLLEPLAPGLDLSDVLRRLTRTNVVSVDRVAKTVTLHPIDQDYAYGQLPDEEGIESDYNRQALERRAADYYAELRAPEETWESIDDLEPMLREFGHRVRGGDYDRACRVLNLVDDDYLFLWGHYGRLARMREQLVGHLRQPSLRLANLGGLGRAYHYLGQAGRALDLYQQALGIAQEINDRGQEAQWLFYCGLALSDTGNVKEAIERFQQALTAYREVGDRQGVGSMLGMLGVAHRLLGRIEESIAYGKQALAISQEVGDRVGEGAWLGNLGTAYRQLGQMKQAIHWYERALAVARSVGDRQREEEWLGNLGVAYRQIGELERSEAYCRRALEVSRQIDHRRGAGEWLTNLGAALHGQGYVEEAVEKYGEALTIAREVDDKRQVGNRLHSLGNAYLELGQITRAVSCYRDALIVARGIADRRGEGKALAALGNALGILGEPVSAEAHIQRALSISRRISDGRKTGLWLARLADVLSRAGRFDQAIEWYEESLESLKKVGSKQGESYDLLMLGKALLSVGRICEARRYAQEARRRGMGQAACRAALLLGTILLYDGEVTAGGAFQEAADCCQSLLEKAGILWGPRYTLAAALVGQAVCDTGWEEEGQRHRLLVPVLEEYRRGLEITSAPGAVQDAIRDLKLIQAAGIEGLEPVFELLGSAEYDPDERVVDTPAEK